MKKKRKNYKPKLEYVIKLERFLKLVKNGK